MIAVSSRSPFVILTHVFFFLQDGVNWLAFLNKYKLHGILCDGILLEKYDRTY